MEEQLEKAGRSERKMQNGIVRIHLKLGSLSNNLKETKRGENQEGGAIRKGTGFLTVKINEPGWGQSFVI